MLNLCSVNNNCFPVSDAVLADFLLIVGSDLKFSNWENFDIS